MHVVTRLPRRNVVHGRRMHSPPQRGLVRRDIGLNDTGLGELDGMFNIGKMFTRMFTFRPGSFKLKNIVGAIGSLTTATLTAGTANIAAELAKPLTKGKSITSAHSKPMQYVGYGTMAVGAVAGAVVAAPSIGTALGVGKTAATGTGLAVGAPSSGSSTIATALATPVGTGGGGFLSTVGTALSTVGKGVVTGLQTLTSVLPVAQQILGSGQQQQMSQQEQGVDPYAQQYADQYAYQQQLAAQQAQQAAYIQAQQGQMYNPVAYAQAQPVAMNTPYGDLRSPYTAITEDGEQVQIDPTTGQVIPSGIPTEMLVGGGVLTLLLGWYLLSD